MAFLMLRTLLFALSVGALRPSGTNVRARPLRGSVLERESDECRLSDDGGDYCNSCLSGDCPSTGFARCSTRCRPSSCRRCRHRSLARAAIRRARSKSASARRRGSSGDRPPSTLSLRRALAERGCSRDGASSLRDEPEDSAHERILTVLATSTALRHCVPSGGSVPTSAAARGCRAREFLWETCPSRRERCGGRPNAKAQRQSPKPGNTPSASAIWREGRSSSVGAPPAARSPSTSRGLRRAPRRVLSPPLREVPPAHVKRPAALRLELRDEPRPPQLRRRGMRGCGREVAAISLGSRAASLRRVRAAECVVNVLHTAVGERRPVRSGLHLVVLQLRSIRATAARARRARGARRRGRARRRHGGTRPRCAARLAFDPRGTGHELAVHGPAAARRLGGCLASRRRALRGVEQRRRNIADLYGRRHGAASSLVAICGAKRRASARAAARARAKAAYA